MNPLFRTSRNFRLLLIAVAALPGCGSSDEDPAPVTTSSPFIGAWSGVQSDGKDYCVIFCENGRYFGADQTRGCTDLADTDFSTYLQHAIQGNRVTLSDAAGQIGVMTGEFSGNHATFTGTWEGGSLTYSMDKVSAAHELCESPAATLRPRR